jgi:hypothetical protein
MTSSVLIAHLKRLVWRARAEQSNNHPKNKNNSKTGRKTEPRSKISTNPG